MNGPAHYREAERLLTPRVGQVELSSPAGYEHTVPRPGGIEPPSDRDVALAAVHATLALAAVTAAAELSLTSLGADRPIEEWREVIA